MSQLQTETGAYVDKVIKSPVVVVAVVVAAAVVVVAVVAIVAVVVAEVQLPYCAVLMTIRSTV